jgi:hypothetical protein
MIRFLAYGLVCLSCYWAGLAVLPGHAPETCYFFGWLASIATDMIWGFIK